MTTQLRQPASVSTAKAVYRTRDGSDRLAARLFGLPNSRMRGAQATACSHRVKDAGRSEGPRPSRGCALLLLPIGFGWLGVDGPREPEPALGDVVAARPCAAEAGVDLDRVADGPDRADEGGPGLLALEVLVVEELGDGAHLPVVGAFEDGPGVEVRVVVARVLEPLVPVDGAPRPLVRDDDVERRAEADDSPAALGGEHASLRGDADARLPLERPFTEQVLQEQVVLAQGCARRPGGQLVDP